jgi:hypothetical protein
MVGTVALALTLLTMVSSIAIAARVALLKP